ncbi:LysR family substrate-binding domain-containing protein [Micromonospora sp. NBC_00860]|nr:LysR family substrate-binding domain-containing protein [Micromonospora sp. NBC_00860]
MALTPAGEAYLDRCRRVLATVADDVHEAGRIGRGEQGRFDIGFVSSAIQLGLAGPIRRFRERHPAVHLRLHEAYTAHIVDRLLNGEVDLGVVRDADDRDDLVGTTFATESFVAVLPADHPHAGDLAIDAAVLRDDPFVFFPRWPASGPTSAIFGRAWKPATHRTSSRTPPVGPQWRIWSRPASG